MESLLLEWNRIQDKIEGQEVVSIYFGGGTPTLFGVEPIAKILSTLEKEANLATDCEITIEANPEDVTPSLMEGYREAGINRVSIGVQSLQDDSLIVLERTHNANKAVEAIEATYNAGLHNISIDLMYDLPNQSLKSFQKTLDQVGSLPITHLSLYNLTIEPNTAFFKRTLSLPSSEESFKMLQAATNHLGEIGLHRYEISAFAKPGFTSKHNTGYWTARPFFGLGPSAFSYHNGARFRNSANINKYAKALKANTTPVDFKEKLPYPQSVHELLAVELRLLRGVDLEKFTLPKSTHSLVERLTDEGYFEENASRLKLSEKGLLFYDTVAGELVSHSDT